MKTSGRRESSRVTKAAVCMPAPKREGMLQEDADVAMRIHSMRVDALDSAGASAQAAHRGNTHVFIGDEILDVHQESGVATATATHQSIAGGSRSGGTGEAVASRGVQAGLQAGVDWEMQGRTW